MGCFDYECECGGETCIYTGGQDGGDSDVVIEVPLNDGTTVYVKGRYESYGSVHVDDYQFYPEQFEDYFEGWLSSESDESRSKIFRAGKIWTLSYIHHKYDEEEEYAYAFKKTSNCYPDTIVVITNLESSTLSKCIRADTGLGIPTNAEKKAKKIAELQSQIKLLQSRLDELLQT